MFLRASLLPPAQWSKEIKALLRLMGTEIKKRQIRYVNYFVRKIDTIYYRFTHEDEIPGHLWEL